MYLILFGLNVAPLFELVNWGTDTQIPPLHACSSNPVDIRKEVENLKTSFNMRMKQILFNSILNAYYAGFIPCCFAQVKKLYLNPTYKRYFFFFRVSYITMFTGQRSM